MDIQIALDTLKALRATIDSEVKGKQGQLDALDLAASQLEGILVTTNAAADASVAAIQAQLDDAQATITSLHSVSVDAIETPLTP